MRPIDVLLSRLQVKRKCDTHYQAECPAHSDHSPSLSIRVFPDDSCSVKCWAGCTTDEIMEAIGLEVRDLFVNNPRVNEKGKSLKALADGLRPIAVGLSDVAKGTPVDYGRLSKLIWRWLDSYEQ